MTKNEFNTVMEFFNAFVEGSAETLLYENYFKSKKEADTWVKNANSVFEVYLKYNVQVK